MCVCVCNQLYLSSYMRPLAIMTGPFFASFFKPYPICFSRRPGQTRPLASRHSAATLSPSSHLHQINLKQRKNEGKAPDKGAQTQTKKKIQKNKKKKSINPHPFFPPRLSPLRPHLPPQCNLIPRRTRPRGVQPLLVFLYLCFSKILRPLPPLPSYHL